MLALSFLVKSLEKTSAWDSVSIDQLICMGREIYNLICDPTDPRNHLITELPDNITFEENCNAYPQLIVAIGFLILCTTYYLICDLFNKECTAMPYHN